MTHLGVAARILLLGSEDADEVRGALLEAGLGNSSEQLGLEGHMDLGGRDQHALGASVGDAGGRSLFLCDGHCAKRAGEGGLCEAEETRQVGQQIGWDARVL